MFRARIILVLAALCLGWPCLLFAQQEPEWQMDGLTDDSAVVYDFQTGLATATNGVIVRYGGAVLTADRMILDQAAGDVTAEGRVRVQRDDQVWASEHLSYNFKTRVMRAQQFRTGKNPVFAAGEGLGVNAANDTLTATNALITTEDSANPLIKVRARSITIIPGDRIQARHAWLYVGPVPVFFFPYYSRPLDFRANNFNFVPGYRTRFGPFLLSSYTWQIDQHLEAIGHVDYRVRRGFGLGPDLNYDYGRWGRGTARYYYLRDQDPNADRDDIDLPTNRQRVWLSYHANPVTNLAFQSVVRYEGDPDIVRDFFEGEYRDNPQPSTYVEASKFWRNFSLDVYAQPRVNDFLETVERLPDVRLSGFRQRLGPTPLFYESETSAGYYRRLFPDTNGVPYGLDYEGARADTWHQLLLPYSLFGWLNVTPRAGGRFTHYTRASGPGADTGTINRGVFNTGGEVSLKASRLWTGATSKWLEVDGLRHILEPSLNYVYIPRPSDTDVPQFDYELASLRVLPIELPDFNAIDSIDSQNTLRLGLRNRFQTRRKAELVNLADWELFTDWRLDPRNDQTTFSDLTSDLVLRPRSWLLFESLTRYDFDNGQFRLAFNSMTLYPSDVWSWTLGQFYLRDDFRPVPAGWGEGNNVFMSSILLRLNQNWGFRATQHFEARDGRMEEQSYTIYRDLRSWTAALALRLRDNQDREDDFTIAFTFSLKAFPRYTLGSDVLRPYSLLE